MDPNANFMSPKFKDRPIILSPPPVEQQGAGNFSLGSMDQPAPNYQRNQSVGYNLQQEFEALKADLDLDLSNTNVNETLSGHDLSSNAGPSSTTMAQSGSRILSGGPSLLSPSTSNQGYLGSNLSESLLRDPNLSSGNGGSGLHGLLNNKSTGFLPPLSSVPSRPQSVNDFSNLMPRQKTSQFSRLQQTSNFYPDVLAYTSWMENLSQQEFMALLDHWCSSLPFDILLTMKAKLETHLHQGPQASGPSVFGKVGGYSQYHNDFVSDMESMSLGDSMRSTSTMGSGGLVQPKPKTNAFKSHLFADPKVQRPKSADPSLHNRFSQGQSPMDRARSPTSHFYEKTNFLQLAAASNSSHMYSQGQHVSNSSEEGLDSSAASKLGALATINSRVALDSNRKNHQPVAQARGHSALSYEESINRMGNSSSVPASTSQKYSVAAALSGPSASGIKAKKDTESPAKTSLNPSNSPSSGSSSMPSEIASPELLNNIPAWLKLLRLHKYTDCLKDVHWRELVELDDQQLEEKGVKALGARRKLLKAFDVVKQMRT
ncbi:hypothetical protein CLUG_04449 [Clavispora lusitaniae ATCC 42720]|uniref:RNA-binding protein VTS1 n=1 Tax=Clavispora lusitaniae (strain ATCC 42720) TaxID=306902 RepID=C4Y8C1_CLAL4|nr:uncharacterized protein CLUG_04449 [Clavispora lusitaniae ATCC 42720]EEQ40321.1 hypothetical protein CLUG_04449 [Clavispora lusitaniae ATCC 42720]